MDERACRRGTCGRSGLRTRVISQAGPGSWAHDRRFGVNAQCLGPAACTFVRAWFERRCVCAGSARGCGQKTNKPTSRWANKQHEARSSIHGGHERVRMLLPAFAGSKHPEKSTNGPHCGRRAACQVEENVYCWGCLPAAPWCGARARRASLGLSGRPREPQGAPPPPGRCDSSDCV